MTFDAMEVWKSACEESQEAWHRIGEQPNDPEGVEQGRLTDQAAAAVIAQAFAGIVAERDAIWKAWSKLLPIRVENGPDYAEVFFGDGQTHNTQAMTMNPQDWCDLALALGTPTHDE